MEADLAGLPARSSAILKWGVLALRELDVVNGLGAPLGVEEKMSDSG